MRAIREWLDSMCHKVIYSYGDKRCKVSFAYENARLPVLTKKSDVKLFPWGRRKHQPGILPLGGWAMLEDIYDGKWDRFFPKPVKLPILSFLARNFEDKEQWFHLPSDKWIQGLLAREKKEERLYIVTLAPDEESIYLRWPRIMFTG